ncbi:MAG TPA: transporter substrate-binding domain-containing protein [Virgibacillus sp.]|nr:transporter substrate-binding domain-containing protein [Virgibacillus sp.]
MLRRFRKKYIIIALASLFLVACQAGERKLSEDDGDKRKVKIAYAQSGKPMAWTDENGEPAGYDVEVLKRVEEKLAGYEFEYIGTTDDDLLIGVEQGKFQVGVKNAFFTEERDKKFIYPKEFLGLSSIGLVVKSEDKELDTLDAFAKAGKTLVPIAANSAQYTVIQEFNDENPGNEVKLVAGDTFSVDVVQWVNEERYDGGIMIEGPFAENVLVEGALYEEFKDDVVYNEFSVIKTWPLFNNKEQQFADDYDQALKELKKEGVLSELSEEFYGRDLFDVLDEVER